MWLQPNHPRHNAACRTNKNKEKRDVQIISPETFSLLFLQQPEPLTAIILSRTHSTHVAKHPHIQYTCPILTSSSHTVTQDRQSPIVFQPSWGRWRRYLIFPPSPHNLIPRGCNPSPTQVPSAVTDHTIALNRAYRAFWFQIAFKSWRYSNSTVTSLVIFVFMKI